MSCLNSNVFQNKFFFFIFNDSGTGIRNLVQIILSAPNRNRYLQLLITLTAFKKFDFFPVFIMPCSPKLLSNLIVLRLKYIIQLLMYYI